MGKGLPATFVTLYYHSIKPKDLRRFVRQMELLNRLAQPISADMKKRLDDDAYHVAITFDDGFRSVVENALPEIVARKIPVAIFIPTGYLGQRADWIENGSHEDRQEVVMTEDEIRGLPKDLVTLGSHSVTHPNLRLIGEDRLRRELIKSRKRLQSITGQSITLLSIPHGEYDERVVEAAFQAGYQRVFSSMSRLAGKNEYVIQRVLARPSDWPLEFRLKILGAYRWLPFILGLKRKLSLTKMSRAVR